MERRVVDLVTGRRGTAWARIGRADYRVRWDEPTPHQDEAWARIPSEWFQWVDDEDDG